MFYYIQSLMLRVTTTFSMPSVATEIAVAELAYLPTLFLLLVKRL